MHGLEDLKASSGDKYATLNVTFEGKSLEITGLIVESICSQININDPSSAPDMSGIDLTMDFNGDKSAGFEIGALIGLDVMAKVISNDTEEDVRMKKIDDLLLIKIGGKFLPFGSIMENTTFETPRKKTLLNIAGPSGVRRAFLDVLLQEFFKSEEPPSPLQKTMEEEVNESYEKKFKKTYALIDNKDELGVKRFSVIPHWKPGELRPVHVPEVTTKETLRRFRRWLEE